MTLFDLDHSDLCKIGVDLLKRRFGCNFAVRELVTFSSETPDCFGVRNAGQESYLVEVKVSRSDFLRDRKKSFRKRPQEGVGMFRYYMAPQGLITIEDLPDKWGLIEVDAKGNCKVAHGHKPKKIADPDFVFTERSLRSELTIVHSFLRRMLAGEDLSSYI